MKAIILNYGKCSVEAVLIPDYVGSESENIEKYLAEECGYFLDEIHYMTVRDSSAPVPVFLGKKQSNLVMFI